MCPTGEIRLFGTDETLMESLLTQSPSKGLPTGPTPHFLFVLKVVTSSPLTQDPWCTPF